MFCYRNKNNLNIHIRGGTVPWQAAERRFLSAFSRMFPLVLLFCFRRKKKEWWRFIRWNSFIRISDSETWAENNAIRGKTFGLVTTGGTPFKYTSHSFRTAD